MDKNKLIVIASIFLEELDDDDDDLLAVSALQDRSSNNSVALSLLKERKKHFRLGHLYRENLNWIDRYLDADFHHRFRMKKDTYRELVDVIRPLYPVKFNRGNSALVTVEVEVLVTLNYIRHEVAMDGIGDKFGICVSTVHKKVHRVVAILCALSPFIVWPRQNECPIIQQQFHARAQFPGVLGAIDGCHVEVLAPANDQDSYTDRKMNHSIILQGICTATKIFTNVSVGTPGSRNDNRALDFSSFHRKLCQNGPLSLLYEDNYHLVGDKAYPNRSWLMAAYKHVDTLNDRKKYIIGVDFYLY